MIKCDAASRLSASVLFVACKLIRHCGRIWLVGGRISPGMAIEAEHARRHGVPVYDLSYLGLEPPEEAG